MATVRRRRYGGAVALAELAAVPLPFPGDGVCEVSRGENSTNAPADCVATCGDGIAQPGETNVSCPGDMPYF